MSPVLFCICHENGSFSMCLKRLSRIVLTSVSEPFVLKTRKVYCEPTLKSETTITARAGIHRFAARYPRPPAASVRIFAAEPGSGSAPGRMLSTVMRMICGMTISASAVTAAEIIPIKKNILLPRRKTAIIRALPVCGVIVRLFLFISSSFVL